MVQGCSRHGDRPFRAGDYPRSEVEGIQGRVKVITTVAAAMRFSSPDFRSISL